MTLAAKVDKWKRIRSLLSYEDIQEVDRLLRFRERIEALATEMEAFSVNQEHYVPGPIRADAVERHVARRLRELLEGK